MNPENRSTNPGVGWGNFLCAACKKVTQKKGFVFGNDARSVRYATRACAGVREEYGPSTYGVRLPQDAWTSAWHELNASPRSKEAEFERGRMQRPCKQPRRGAGRSRRPTDGIARGRLAMGGSNVHLICTFGPSISDSADRNCVPRRLEKAPACCFVVFVRVKRRLSTSTSPSAAFSLSSSQEAPPGDPRRPTSQYPTSERKSPRKEGEI